MTLSWQEGKTASLRMKARLNFTRLQNQYQPGRRAKERLQAQYPQVPAWNPGGSDPGVHTCTIGGSRHGIFVNNVALSFSCAREFGSIVAQANVEVGGIGKSLAVNDSIADVFQHVAIVRTYSVVVPGTSHQARWSACHTDRQSAHFPLQECR